MKSRRVRAGPAGHRRAATPRSTASSSSRGARRRGAAELRARSRNAPAAPAPGRRGPRGASAPRAPDLRRNESSRQRVRLDRGAKAKLAPRERGGVAAPRSLLDVQPWDSLLPFLKGSSVGSATTIQRLRRYAELLVDWNRQVSNLISRNDEARIVERHLRESLEPLTWLRESGAQRWLDFGSGAGLPAIPLAIAGLGPHWTLVESRRSKTLFIRKTLSELRLSGIDVVNERLESLAERDERPRDFTGFTSRATLPLGPTLLLAAKFVVPRGHAFLWKGSRHEEEMSRDKRWTESWNFESVLRIGDGRSTVAMFIRK